MRDDSSPFSPPILVALLLRMNCSERASKASERVYCHWEAAPAAAAPSMQANMVIVRLRHSWCQLGYGGRGLSFSICNSVCSRSHIPPAVHYLDTHIHTCIV
jgi:hypothetical protein